MSIVSCQACSSQFLIGEDDLAFYQKVSPSFANQTYQIPPPSLCPNCRMQRRLAFRNERTLYKRSCDFSGKNILSIYAPGTGFTVYDKDIWYSDQWDPLSVGRPFDFSRPFFEQFKELHALVPMLAINHQTENENCDYCNLVSRNKRCYLIFAANDCEDCFYSTYLQRCRDVCDCFFVFDCELCYQCIDCYGCYNVQHSRYSLNCSDSWFISNCQAVSHCIACVSLQNKRYHIFNQAYSKEQYQAKVKELLSRDDFREYCNKEMLQLIKTSPHKYYQGLNNEEITGDHVSFSKHSFDCYDCTYLEDCKYCTWLHRARDCYDCYAWGLPAELSYENHLCGNGYYHLLFCESCWNNVSDLIYCRYCTNGSKNLFGCVGLRCQEYCVLNQRYSQAEYASLVGRIIDHMKQTGEWGEYFPMSLSPFAYNETVAQEYFPLSREVCAVRNLRWTTTIPHTAGKETIKCNQIPSRISDVPASICSEILACTNCQKNFRITQAEYQLYQKLTIPIPQLCFDCRYHARQEKRNPRVLAQRRCNQCATEVLSTYSPDRLELVYCEKCYYASDQ